MDSVKLKGKQVVRHTRACPREFRRNRSGLFMVSSLVSPEVILLELALGNPDVLGTVRLIHRTKPEVPLIVIGDPLEKEIAVASLREGAMDYLLKNHMDALLA